MRGPGDGRSRSPWAEAFDHDRTDLVVSTGARMSGAGAGIVAQPHRGAGSQGTTADAGP